MVRWLVLATVLALTTSLAVPVVEAQDQPPPQLGEVVVADAMTAPGLARPQDCPTGANPAQFGEDGLTLTLNGSCFSAAGFDRFKVVSFPGLRVPDGEVRFDVRVTSGIDQFSLGVSARQTPYTPGMSVTTMRQAQVSLIRKTDQASVMFARESTFRRHGLAALLQPDTWFNVAIRLQGNTVWLLIDDQPFMSSADPGGDAGNGTNLSVVLQLFEPEGDRQDVVLTLRNFKVTALAGSEVERLPSVGAVPPPSSAASAQPVPSGPPWVGDVKFGWDPSGAGATGDGGTVNLATEGTLHAFFSWRNVPIGSTFNIEYIVGYDPGRHFSEPVTRPSGTLRMPLVRGGPLPPESVLVVNRLTLIVSLNGNEMARASVNLK